MTPVFAVVGHPNKGKSSIVSTIAQNDNIAISPRSGTTRETQSYDISIGAARYTLVDTPGFQRPSRALAWLQEHAPSAERRRDAVRQFIDDPQCRQQFPEEVMLLKPIMEGAAILYVVDGSRPYGAEYEAEMEILRWTGQASMALINPIENEDHVQDWQQALGQYFKIVRVFNAMQADFEKVVAILEAFSHIREEWQTALADIVGAYRGQRASQLRESASLLAELLTRLCTHQVSQKVLSRSQADGLKPILEKKYFDDMRRLEHRHHESLKRIYQYHHLESTIDELPLEGNLFDTEKWIVWGLNPTSSPWPPPSPARQRERRWTLHWLAAASCWAPWVAACSVLAAPGSAPTAYPVSGCRDYRLAAMKPMRVRSRTVTSLM